MLTTQFAFFFHPVKESTLWRTVYNWSAQSHILKAFGIIIRVDTAQGFVQQVDKAFKFGRLLLKLNDPFMGAAFIAVKINGPRSLCLPCSSV